MTAIRQDITIEQGADYDTPFLLKDDDGSPDDLTGSAFVMQIRFDFDAPALFTLSTAAGTLALDAANGIVRPAVGADATSAFYAGSYVYDLKERTAGGKVRRRRQGVVTITRQVTLADFAAGVPDFALNEDGGYTLNEDGSRVLNEDATPAPATPSYMLNEDGGYALNEDGSHILNEDSQ